MANRTLGYHRHRFDLHEMTGYDTKARKAWQQHLGPLKDSILSITVQGGSNTVVRMGAAVLGLALGIIVQKDNP